MVLYCIIIGLAVYYLALWGWHRRVAVNNRTAPQPERKKRENTASLVGESHFRSGLMRTNGDILGHFPQAVENDTTFAPDAGGENEETDFKMTFEEAEEPDYEDEEIAGYMEGDDTGRAAGVSFEELGEAVRTANADPSTEAEQRQAAGTLARIEGTNLYDAVVENINGGLAKVAELLGRNEAELAAAAVPAEAGNKSKEHEAFDMNDFL